MFKPSDSYEIHKKTVMSKVATLRDYRKQHANKYNKIFRFALDNWYALCDRASRVKYGDNVVSVADQIQVHTNCPYFVAEDIANSISCSKAIG